MSCPKCGSSDKHFCPPSLGEPGFYLCECRAPASPALAEAAREVMAYRETAKESSRVHVELHNQNVDLQAEVARLTDCLKTANGHHEHFERRWYLCQDRIAELEAGLRRVYACEDAVCDQCASEIDVLLDNDQTTHPTKGEPMTKAIRIENADTSNHKVKVEVWEKNSIREDGTVPPDKLIRVEDLNLPTQMIQETIWANRYLVVRESA